MTPAKKLEKLTDELRNLAELVADRDGVQAEIFDRIDWKLLRKQQATLVKTYEALAKGKQYDHLRGIDNLIDMLQCIAVDYDFVKPEKVFGDKWWDR